MEASVSEHFEGNRCINCMAHSSENLFQYRETSIIRAADDFYPSEAPSHPVHIAQVRARFEWLWIPSEPSRLRLLPRRRRAKPVHVAAARVPLALSRRDPSEIACDCFWSLLLSGRVQLALPRRDLPRRLGHVPVASPRGRHPCGRACRRRLPDIRLRPSRLAQRRAAPPARASRRLDARV